MTFQAAAVGAHTAARELNKGLLGLIALLSVVIARSILAYATILSLPDADTVLLRCCLDAIRLFLALLALGSR